MTKRSYDVITSDNHKPIKMWTRGVDADDVSMNQLRNVASLPFIYRHVSVMPDVHCGWGATIGSVIPTVGAIIPAAVGSDIGCGMAGIRINGVTKENVMPLVNKTYDKINREIPLGFKKHKHNLIAKQEDIMDEYGVGIDFILALIEERHPRIAKTNKGKQLIMRDLILQQFGTLGGGNHFIELCFDEDGAAWVILHSGSRRIGKQISDHFIERAKELMEAYYISLPDPDLAFLAKDSLEYTDYVLAMNWAQQYARANRARMLNVVTEIVANDYNGTPDEDTYINCHHNFAEIEHHFGRNVLVTRKGATRARLNDKIIIPGSMGSSSYVCVGKGNEESFTSCSHGAGRVMGRREAKRAVSMGDHIAAMGDVVARVDPEVIEETPAAYKPIESVMAAQKDLVDVKHVLKQVLCVKG